MGICRLTAMLVQSHPNADLLVDAAKHDNGLWSGWLYLLRDGEIHQPIFSSDPVYESADEAREVIRHAVASVRELGDKIFADDAVVTTQPAAQACQVCRACDGKGSYHPGQSGGGYGICDWVPCERCRGTRREPVGASGSKEE